MIEAMIGRRMAEVGRPPPPTHAIGRAARRSLWRARHSGQAFRMSISRRAARARSWRSSASSARAPQRSARRPSASARLDARRRWRSRASVASYAPADGRHPRGIGLPARRPQGRRCLHGPAGGGERGRRQLAATCHAAASSATASRRARSAAGASGWPSARATTPSRPWAPCRAATSRRCCWHAGSSGTRRRLCSSSRRAVSTSARARTSIGRCATWRRHGVAVLVVTSDYEEAVQVADRAYVMAKGRVVAELSGDDITTSRLLAAAGG